MPLILHAAVEREFSSGGSIHQTLVGSERWSIPFQIRLQRAPPGYETRLHSHPYLEVLMVNTGEAEAWTEEDKEIVRLVAGVILIVPANIKHWFRVLGHEPLSIYGIHVSPQRITHFYE